jgi:CubicO group peptidase (beta-lactamase class C family)
MRPVRILSFAALIAATSHFVAAQPRVVSPWPALTPQQTASIDRFVKEQMARERIPGLPIGVYRRGHVLLAEGYGLADVELTVPVTPETLFQSGSTGKQYISAAIMMLVEAGKLFLDDSIAKYFPGAPATWKPILARNHL